MHLYKECLKGQGYISFCTYTDRGKKRARTCEVGIKVSGERWILYMFCTQLFKKKGKVTIFVYNRWYVRQDTLVTKPVCVVFVFRPRLEAFTQECAGSCAKCFIAVFRVALETMRV